MVIDSVVGHRRTADAIAAFLASGEPLLEINAAGVCHLFPDQPVLRTFRVVKSQGPLKVEELEGGVLQVSGRPDLLAEYANEFRVDASRDGTHAHPEHRLAFQKLVDPDSIFTILEVDDCADDPAGGAAEANSEAPEPPQPSDRVP